MVDVAHSNNLPCISLGVCLLHVNGARMSLRVSVRPADVTNMASTCVKVVDYKIARSDIGVLLVEDDPESAGLTLTKVSEGKDSPFRVEWADDLQRAMSRLAQPGIDVVLLD